MRTLLVLYILFLPAAGRDVKIVGRSFPRSEAGVVYPQVPRSDRVLIDQVGDVLSVLGSQGKSIAVSSGGEVIAVIYGAPSGNPTNPMIVKVAYSLNGGVSWTRYGPFSAPLSRIYNDIAATPDFNGDPGELWFAWQDGAQGYINVMIEENLPAAPSFSVPITLPNSAYMWEPSITVAQDDDVVTTAYSYLSAGNCWAYCWISIAGGYSWIDTIPMAYISPDGAAGALAAGVDGYLFYGYVDYYSFTPTDSAPYPYYMESIDGGYTWSAETPITVFPVNASSQYWWHEFDCLVINGEPWVVFNDIGAGGTGGPHIARATGSPGNWTWSTWNAGVLGHDSTWYGDTLYYCEPVQYPSLSYDPIHGRVLASYKSDIYIGDGTTWAMCDGAHIQGIYTSDGGNTWCITKPLSTLNTGTIAWDAWSATETADRLVNTFFLSWNYSICVIQNPATGASELYFENGSFGDWWDWPTTIDEAGDVQVNGRGLILEPSMTGKLCRVRFTVIEAGNISLRIYDAAGRLVEEMVNTRLESGTHRVDMRTDGLASGTYFVVLQTGSGLETAKVTVAH